jgi:hypothetical protein
LGSSSVWIRKEPANFSFCIFRHRQNSQLVCYFCRSYEADRKILRATIRSSERNRNMEWEQAHTYLVPLNWPQQFEALLLIIIGFQA